MTTEHAYGTITISFSTYPKFTCIYITDFKVYYCKKKKNQSEKNTYHALIKNVT